MNDLRIRSISRGAEIKILINGRPHIAYEGENVHAALLAAGYRALRKTTKMDQPRGFFCGMGVCYDCQVTINGMPNQRACMTPVRYGMEIQIDA